MDDVRKEFAERVNEIQLYLRLIAVWEDEKNDLVVVETATSVLDANDRRLALRTLKASTFLLLYNLVESTVTSAVCSIYDDMKAHNVGFDSCRQEIRLRILKNLKAHSPESIMHELQQIALDVVTKTHVREKIASGNIDGQEIRKITKSYGIEAPHANGSNLVTVKDNRNDLAHGVKSFAAVGRDTSLQDLQKLMQEGTSYLQALLDNTDNYITNKKYLTANQGQNVGSSVE